MRVPICDQYASILNVPPLLYRLPDDTFSLMPNQPRLPNITISVSNFPSPSSRRPRLTFKFPWYVREEQVPYRLFRSPLRPIYRGNQPGRHVGKVVTFQPKPVEEGPGCIISCCVRINFASGQSQAVKALDIPLCGLPSLLRRVVTFLPQYKLGPVCFVNCFSACGGENISFPDKHSAAPASVSPRSGRTSTISIHGRISSHNTLFH